MGDSKYKNAKIYRIIDVAYSGKCYIGSTCEGLSQRLARHKYMYTQYTRNGKETHRSANAIFDLYGVENCKIELIEAYPCDNKMELLKREGQHIRDNDCINKRVAGRTDEEYREENKEKEQQRHKKYNEENKDKIRAKREQNKEQISKRNKAYRENNKQLISERRKLYRQNNKEKIKESQRKCYEANKEERNKKNKEYYVRKKDLIIEQNKAYHERNKEKILENRKQKYTCECGCILRKDGKHEHLKSKKHQDLMAQQEMNEQQ